MAPARDPEGAGRAQGQARAPSQVLRDHEERDPEGDRSAGEAVEAARQCAAGAPRARLPGRLQPLAAAMEEGDAGFVGRARAKRGAAPDLRPRSRSRRRRTASRSARASSRSTGGASRPTSPRGASPSPTRPPRAPPSGACSAPATAGSRPMRSSPSRARAVRRRRFGPRRCSRPPPTVSASARGARCSSRRSSTRASISARGSWA